MRGGKFGGTAQTDWLVTVWAVHHVRKDISPPHGSSGTPPANSLSLKCVIISVLSSIGGFLHKITPIMLYKLKH